VITFLIVAAVLAILATLFVVAPLLKGERVRAFSTASAEQSLSVYRDQLTELENDRRNGRLGADEYDLARGELENRLLEEMPETITPAAVPEPRRHHLMGLAAAIGVPMLAIVVYFLIGNPSALGTRHVEPAHGLGQQQMDQMIGRLAARLEKNPQDFKGWVMLARAQAVLGRFDKASAAYARSIALVPDDAQLLADYADVLAMAQGGRLQGEPEKLIDRALLADPNNAKALALAGTVAFNRKDFTLALQRWERLRASIPAGSEFAKSIQGSIDEAKKLSLAYGAKRVATDAQGAARAPASRRR